MSRYWRIYRTFFTSSLVRELEFRANFVAKMLQNAAWVLFYVLMVLVIFSRTNSIAGWTQEDVFILMATVFLMSSVHRALFMSCFEIPEQVRRGTLDFVITKPVDTQFWVSVRRFDWSSLGAIIASFVMFGYGLVQGKLAPSAGDWAAYVLLVLLALILFYALGMILMTLAIYFVRVDNLWVVGETVLETARFPIDVYRTGIRDLLVVYIPLGFLATVPAKAITQGAEWPLVGIGAIWAAGFMVLARWFWTFSLKSYTSASS